jgi:hypothetical protein
MVLPNSSTGSPPQKKNLLTSTGHAHRAVRSPAATGPAPGVVERHAKAVAPQGRTVAASGQKQPEGHSAGRIAPTVPRVWHT